MQSNLVRLQLPFEVKERLKRGDKFTILDVREHEEWEAGHIPQAKHIPLGELETRLNELNPNEWSFAAAAGEAASRESFWWR